MISTLSSGLINLRNPINSEKVVSTKILINAIQEQSDYEN